MFIPKRIISLFLILSVISGCANSTRRFSPNPLTVKNVHQNIKEKIYLNKVTMPKNDVKIMPCRLESIITLPDNMTFSQYIKNAIEETLVSADRLSHDIKESVIMDVVVKKVDMSSFNGEWIIDGDVILDNNQVVPIKSITHFGRAFIATHACRNATESFDEAVSNFVNLALKKADVVYYIAKKESNKSTA